MAEDETTKRERTRIGWREVVDLPGLGVSGIKAKIDTGARTSALHAENKETFEKNGLPYIAFDLPDGRRVEAELFEARDIKNTSGVPETRPVIRTSLRIAGRRWKIDLSLADRTEMNFDLILGRTAVRGHRLLVDPGQSFLVSDAPEKGETT